MCVSKRIINIVVAVSSDISLTKEGPELKTRRVLCLALVLLGLMSCGAVGLAASKQLLSNPGFELQQEGEIPRVGRSSAAVSWDRNSASSGEQPTKGNGSLSSAMSPRR